MNSVVEKLLKDKLVSSCQIVESDSRWNWNNEYDYSKEFLVFMKTKKSLIKDIYEVIKDIHSYDYFEFAIFDLDSYNINYLNLIEEETK